MKDERYEKVAKLIYDIKKDRVTHVKLDGHWVSVGELALKRSLNTAALGKFLNIALTRRLMAANSLQSRGTSKKLAERAGAWQGRIARLISRHTRLREGEVHSVVRALSDEDVPDERLMAVLSVLARRSGVPFREFAQEVADLI